MDVIDKVAPLCGEKIIISAEFSQTDVAAALMCLGEELTPERWEQVKAAPSKKPTSAVAALYMGGETKCAMSSESELFGRCDVLVSYGARA